jgi:glucosamine 6-phosphate synthetase-like amidotransferase/phosphosugar isomerase protein
MGEVDSEIIFHMLNKSKENLNEQALIDIFNELEGLFAVLAYNTSVPNMVYGLREERPIEFGYISALGVMIAISEKDYLDNTMSPFDRWRVREDYGNRMPYLTIEWVKTIETGVFTMDLDTEVDTDTKPADLIRFKHVKKETKTTTCAHYAKDNVYGIQPYGVHPVSPISTPASTTTAAATTPATDKKAIVCDLTDYGPEEPTKDSLMDELLAQVGEAEKPIGNIEDGSVEIEVVDGDIIEDDDTDAVDETGLTFSNKVAIGSNYLHTTMLNEEEINPESFLSLSVKEQKEIINKKFGIRIKGDEQFVSFVVLMYDHIFPEGFAYGYGEGYNACEEEYSD